MSVATRRLLSAFAAWTLLIWATRFANVWRDDALSTGGKLARTLLLATFVVGAGLLVTLIVRARREDALPTASVQAVRVIACWTIGVWVVRGAQIVLDDHPAGFVAVHLVLAVVSIGLAAASIRAVNHDRVRPAVATPSRV